MKRIFKAPYILQLAVLLLAAAALPAAISTILVREGTILPARLNTTLSSKSVKPGQILTARIMQDIPLPHGAKIPEGATLVGHIVSVTPASNTTGGTISLRFDTLKMSHQQIPVALNLRAIASPAEVEEAQIPTMGPDRGTPPDAWTTIQIGGDVVYRGGGPVEGAFGKVGQPVSGGVLSYLNANPDGGCRGAIDANDTPQALWVFSSDACGLYSLPRLRIAHAGRTDPVGEIILQSTKGEVNVHGGAGLLLRVDSAGVGGA